MTATDATTDTSSSTVLSDCSAFLNWHYNRNESDSEKAVIFQSLVATMKSQPAFDVNLEAKALKFLKSVDPVEPKSADAFLSSHGRTTDESLTHFIQSMVVLISSTSQTITTAAMKMLFSLLLWSSEKVHLSLIKADLIPQLIIALNPHSLSFTEAVDIHINLMKTIRWFVARSTPHSLAELGIQDLNEQQAVHETVFQQVFLPSETQGPANISTCFFLLLDNKHYCPMQLAIQFSISQHSALIIALIVTVTNLLLDDGFCIVS
ncbi:hypothetical protein BLNAU_8926 [Blattamonas nauphoetae]|uniref:Uncharacterized protein n=1 Tax=Blattamonas nauphoetae TaxID=2049346 RepID=A0ABQ9XXD1_9EUKA|nr:hypothetical protein BLNAU_8926 [Blattamonas nauphoetae]